MKRGQRDGKRLVNLDAIKDKLHPGKVISRCTKRIRGGFVGFATGFCDPEVLAELNDRSIDVIVVLEKDPVSCTADDLLLLIEEMSNYQVSTLGELGEVCAAKVDALRHSLTTIPLKGVEVPAPATE